MFCDLYILLKNGEPMPKDQARATQLSGYFAMGEHGPGSHGAERHAYLLEAPRGRVLAMLEHAHVVRVNVGLLVSGQMPSSRYRKTNLQHWWVVPSPPPSIAIEPENS